MALTLFLLFDYPRPYKLAYELSISSLGAARVAVVRFSALKVWSGSDSRIFWKENPEFRAIKSLGLVLPSCEVFVPTMILAIDSLMFPRAP